MAEVAAPELQACGHQVGGHMKTGVEAATYVDGSGKFYKVLQDRIRGGREIAVYEAVWSVGNPDAKDVDLEGMDPEHLRGLQAFIPKYYGDIEKDGKLMIVMDDMCHGYKKPSVCDLKMGLSTVYPWASDAYKAKAGPKDAATTQVTLGFRMCGFQAYQVPTGEYLKRGRDFGKQLKDDTMPAALAEFGGNGVLTPKDIYPLVLAEVKRLEQWFESQRSLCFYAASVIMVYEGSAETLADANVTIKWVDFAHSFPSKGEPDNNVLPGLKKLISILEGLIA